MPENVAKAKIDYMRVLGAEVHVQPLVPFGDPKHYFQTAEAIAKECGGLFTNQFENSANYLAHFSGTGPEIYSQTDHNVDIFVSAAGTGNFYLWNFVTLCNNVCSPIGGTIGGISMFLKTVNPTVKCFLADPVGSSLCNYVNSGGETLEPSGGGPTIAEGIGSGRITANFRGAQV